MLPKFASCFATPGIVIKKLKIDVSALLGLGKVGAYTGCCKTTGKLWQHINETLYGVFLVFWGSFDCQIWAIFHFGTLWA